MKILVDARTVRRGRSGVGTYTELMLRALSRIGPEHEFIALSLGESQLCDLSANVRTEVVTADYERHPQSEVFENLQLPRLIRRWKADVFWGAAFLVPWVRTRARKVVTIHDLSVFSHAKCFPRGFAAYMRFVIKNSVRSADAVVCDSETTRDTLSRLTALGGTRAEVVYPFANPIFCPATDKPVQVPSGVRSPYVLAVGAGNPRKNTDFLVNAFQRLRRERSLPHSLVLVQDAAWPSNQSSSDEQIVRLPWQSEDDLRSLYREAELLVIPSLDEGFGLPMIEAMACGCPVVAARAGALPEVAGDAARYFDPSNESEAAGVIAEVLESDQLAENLRQAGLKRAAEFTPERSAKQLLRLFDELVSGSRHES
jgi:glycosyltransferase involved in cell wall biosynthesis